MRVDYHTHTKLCKHADGGPEEYIQRALSIGLDEVGCSDHSPMPDNFDAPHRMSQQEFVDSYKPDVLALRERYKGRIVVKFAVEGDFFPGTEEWVGNFNAAGDFDYVIGSVHYLGKWGIDNPTNIHEYEERDVNEVYEQYFQHVRRSAQARLFDIVGHCDLVKKFGHRPTKNMEGLLREVFRTVKESDIAVEINTSGLRKPVKEIYPSIQILSILRECGIPLALGSDAHTPSDVGRDFDLARELVERYGNGRISVFSKRQRSEVRIT